MAALLRCGLQSFRARSFSLKSFTSYISTPNNHSIRTPMIHRLLNTQEMNTRNKLVNDVLRKLQYNDGISYQLFQALQNSMENQGSLSEQDFGLLLHICSGGPFDCPAHKRLARVEEIWTKLDQHGITPSTKLYNVKLKAYCLNKQSFNALEKLTELKNLGLNPDKVTYSLLIDGFCSKGDIDGANSVLEAMKTAQLTINVTVFNSFITGNLKAGLPEEAEHVLELISSSGLDPNVHTFFRFAHHYAEQGDMESVAKYISEAEDAGLPMDPHMLMDLYKAMVTNGHSAAAGQLLQIIAEQSIYSSVYMQRSCNLVSEGLLDSAMELFMADPSLEEGRNVTNSGNSILKTMVANGYTASEIFNMADKLQETFPRTINVHRNALQFAYKAGQTDLAMELLDLMIAKNHEIKVPYTSPAICGYRNQNNVEGVYKATSILLKIPPAGIIDDRVEHLILFSYPALKQCGQSRENIIERFKDDETLWNSIFFLEDLDKDGFDTAIRNAEGKQLDGAVFQWFGAPVRFTKHLPEEVESCVKALKILHKQQSVHQQNFAFLSSRVAKSFMMKKDWSGLEKLLDALVDKKLFLAQSLKQVHLMSDAPEHVQEKLNSVCVSPKNRTRNDDILSQTQLEAMSEAELKQHQKQNSHTFLPRFVLMNKAMEANDLPALQQILKELQVLDFKLKIFPTVKVIAKLVELKDTETALFYFGELKKLTGNSYKSTIALMIGEEMMKQGKVEDALAMLQEAQKSTFREDRGARISKIVMLRSMIENAPTIEDASKVHSTIFQSENESFLIDSEPARLHAAFIRRVGVTEDDDELVNVLLKVYQAHQVFPLHDFILERLISKKDVENLKKVMDLGNSVYGNNYFHHKLAVNFMRCGMPARGATILKTPGLRLNERLLWSQCQNLINEKKIEALESLVTVLKGMSVCQATMLGLLVQGYISVNNLEQATEAIQQFAEDYYKPPGKTVNALIQAYKKEGKNVPESLKLFVSVQNADPQVDSSSSSSSDSDGLDQTTDSPGHSETSPKS